MSRAQLEKSGYLKSFPNLLGCVCALHGTEAEIRAAADAHASGGEWTQSVTSTDLVLSPAACYPTYPLVAARGPMPPGGLLFDVEATCFRHEPSTALNRMQSFRMREYVRLGNPVEIARFREQWMSRAAQFAEALGLPATLDVANDPFFGRVGKIMAISQLQNALKFELLIPYYPGATPTACMSINYHKEHFGETWNIIDAEGKKAQTSCVAFGMDRLAVAMFCRHGTDVSKWPPGVRGILQL
jgi:seryl-tRNA synthetase